MKYAVVRISGHQYKVSEGDEVLVDKQTDKIEPEVLLFVDGEKVTVGEPVLKDAKVKIKVLGDEKGEKLSVFKYKSKSRSRRKVGFRHSFTKLLIEKIDQ